LDRNSSVAFSLRGQKEICSPSVGDGQSAPSTPTPSPHAVLVRLPWQSRRLLTQRRLDRSARRRRTRGRAPLRPIQEDQATLLPRTQERAPAVRCHLLRTQGQEDQLAVPRRPPTRATLHSRTVDRRSLGGGRRLLATRRLLLATRRLLPAIRRYEATLSTTRRRYFPTPCPVKQGLLCASCSESESGVS